MNRQDKKIPKHKPNCKGCIHLKDKNGYRCGIWEKGIFNPALAGFNCEAKEFKK